MKTMNFDLSSPAHFTSHAATADQFDKLKLRNDMARAMMAQNFQPQQGADMGSAFARVASALMAKRGMNQTQAGMDQMQQASPWLKRERF